ncbi:MAG: MFS transporter [Spirochaetales bacterium]|nr:MFS transporter [Spirochaetales bacterium]
MASLLLLVIIYLAFISLGLPDGMLGVAWPQMRLTFAQPLEAAGLLGIILTGCSALSSFLSGYTLKRLGTGIVLLASVLVTGLALLGYSLVPSFWWLLVLTVPLGLGGGSVDSGLNHYVANHYSSRHMNWLHCSWGIGATVGPMIVTGVLASGMAWMTGYRIVSIIQLSLALVFLVTLRLWSDKKQKSGETAEKEKPEEDKDSSEFRMLHALKKQGPWFAILFYAVYAGAEFAAGLWANSLLIESRGIPVETAGFWVALYYGAITAGRFLTGLVSNRLGNVFMVRLGIGIALAGAVVFFIPHPGWLALPGLILLGLGFAPLYPGMMHETPKRFDKNTARAVIGFQVGSACIGGSLIPAGIGLAASRTTLEILAPCLAVLIVLLLFLSERLNGIAKK